MILVSILGGILQVSDGDGQPLDVLGSKIKYDCVVKGCKNKRRMGYKEYCIHNAREHGGVVEVMRASDNPDIRLLANRLQSI